MLGKVTLFVTMAVLSSMSLSVTCAPLSEMKHITLHVQSEILDGHKLVITLEPLDNKTESLPVEFHDPFNVTVVNSGKSNDAGKLNEGSTSADTTAEDVQSDSLDSTTAGTTELPTNSTSSPSGTNDTSAGTLPDDTKRVIAFPTASGEPDVQEFLVTLPNIKCPAGFKAGPDGKCREVFSFSSSIGKSMSHSNLVPDDRMKNHALKFWKKLMMG